MKGVDTVTNLIDSNKKWIEYLLFALIVISLMPSALLGFDVGSQVKSMVRPVTDMMSHSVVQFVLFLVLLWSCCVKRDINMFLLVSVFLLVSRR